MDLARKNGQIVFSQATANELAEIFIRPKFDRYLPLALRLEIIDDFIALSQIIEPTITVTACRDAKDDKFLELALTANAKCIITGDNDLLILNPFQGVTIQTLKEFLSEFQVDF